MADLTPEERQRIYLEEKVRLEARRELQRPKFAGLGKIVLYLFILLVVIVSVMGFIDAVLEGLKTPTERAKERAEAEAQACIVRALTRLEKLGYSESGQKSGAAIQCKGELEKAESLQPQPSFTP